LGPKRYHQTCGQIFDDDIVTKDTRAEPANDESALVSRDAHERKLSRFAAQK